MLGMAISIFAQSAITDFVVVGTLSGDPNMQQVKSRYKANPDVLFTQESVVSGVEQITNAIKGKQISDLHIFVRNDQYGIYLSHIPVTSVNVNDFAVQFRAWKKSVSGKVVIHNQKGVVSPELSDLFIKLKELTSLEFIVNQ